MVVCDHSRNKGPVVENRSRTSVRFICGKVDLKLREYALQRGSF